MLRQMMRNGARAGGIGLAAGGHDTEIGNCAKSGTGRTNQQRSDHRRSSHRRAVGVFHSLAATSAESCFGRVEGLAAGAVAAPGIGGGRLLGDGTRLFEAGAEEQAADAAEDRDDQPEDEEDDGDRDDGDESE